MPTRRWIFPIYLFVLLLSAPAQAFDLDAYRQFLAQNENLSTQELLTARAPAAPYASDLQLPIDDATFLPAVIAKYHLTEDELELVRRHGFMVSERLAQPSYGEALLEIWHADLPVFISSDLILHTVHRSFLRVMQGIESQHLSILLDQTLTALHTALPAIAARYEDDPQMQVCIDDLDVYLTVARSLLADERAAAVRTHNDALVQQLLAAIASRNVHLIALFNETPRLLDFSQFVVRGYYTETPLLSRYFETMMWLGRMDFRLSRDNSASAPASVQREVVDAFLLRELVTQSQTGAHLANIDRVLRLFIGSPDNTTLDDLDAMAVDIGLQNAAQLWDEATHATFETLLDGEAYQPQAINSRILMADAMAGEPLQPPYAFLLLGQRFTVDSHVLGQVVYDHIAYENQPIFRGLPDPLDVLYALGNDDVLPLLKSELDSYHYAANLDALRYLIDSYDDAYWDQSLYTRWIHAIRSLSKTGDQAGAPDFMRTAAWQQEKMNTQLASWAELRHDTLLYVKQSYTSGIICSYPHGYVEPVPELFTRLQAFADFARDEILAVGLPASLSTKVSTFYGHASSVMGTLRSIAQKELDREPLSDTEQTFLQTVLFIDPNMCGTPERGWIRSLYFDDVDWPVGTPDLIVADVHTQPTDEIGDLVGNVLHVGTGDPRLAVVVTGCAGATPVAYVGPVASFHQHVTRGFERLTDEAWEQLLASAAAPGSPDWTWSHVADAQGEIREGGRVLDQGWTVSVEDPQVPPGDQPASLSRVAWVRNTPNPFNPRTVIGFELQGGVPVDVVVRIYDVRGALVRTLLRESLTPTTWFVAWDGKDDAGEDASSGVYLAVVEAASRRLSAKMALVR